MHVVWGNDEPGAAVLFEWADVSVTTNHRRNEAPAFTSAP